MAETRDLNVKLPDGSVKRIRTPADWGPEQIRSALEQRGVLAPSPSAAESRVRPSEAEGVGGFLKATGQQIVERDLAAVGGFAQRAASGLHPRSLKGVPEAAMETAKAGVNQFIYERNEFERLLRDAWRGHAKDEPDNQFSAPGRVGRVGLAMLHMVGAPFTTVAKAFGHNIDKSATQLSGSKNVGETLGVAAEMGALVFSGAGANALRQAVVTAKNQPAVAKMLLEASDPRKASLAMARTANTEAAARGADKKKVFETLEQLGSRMDPAMKKSLETRGWFGPTRAAPMTTKGVGAVRAAGKHPLTEEVLSQDTVKTITDGAAKALAGNYDESKRVFQNIFDMIGQEKAVPRELQTVMRTWGVTPKQLAEEYSHVVSTAGRLLKYHSDVAKTLQRTFKDDEGAQRVLAGMQRSNPKLFEPTIGDYVTRAIGSATNFWRAMLTTQLATAMRNVIASGAYYSMEVAGSALSDAVSGVAKMARGQFNKGMEEMFTSINAAVRTGATLSVHNRAELMRVLDDPKAMGSLYKVRLLSQPMGDLQLTNKVASIANAANRFQEYFIRGAAMEFKLRTLLQKRGMRLETAAGRDIPEDVLEESVDFARRVTFAAEPRAQWLRDFINTWGNDKVPLLLLVNPFPRFTFGNAIPFIVHKSSLGVTHMLSRDAWRGIQKIATKKGDLTAAESERLGRVMTDAASGGALWWSAWNLRQSEHAGENWYEIVTKDGTTIDTRPFAPFSTFLFLSEFMQRPERIKWQDWAEAFIGMSRLGGTSLMVSDLIRAKDAFQGFQTLKRFAGTMIGGLATPLRQFRDMVEFDFEPEDAILRDTRQDPLIGPFLNNLPYFHRKLPTKFSPLREGELLLSKPTHEFEFMGRKYNMNSMLLRQLTGVTQFKKTAIQKKVDELQLDPAMIYPRTGNTEADNIVAKGQGYFMHHVAEPILPRIDALPEPVQRALLRRLFVSSKAYGRALMAATHPRLWNEVKALRADEDNVQIMREFGGINPYQAIDEALAERGFRAPKLSRGVNE